MSIENSSISICTFFFTEKNTAFIKQCKRHTTRPGIPANKKVQSHKKKRNPALQLLRLLKHSKARHQAGRPCPLCLAPCRPSTGRLVLSATQKPTATRRPFRGRLRACVRARSCAAPNAVLCSGLQRDDSMASCLRHIPHFLFKNKIRNTIKIQEI